ncbi:hypothetical protein D3C75_978800 [compost metagenome]
MTDAAAYNDVDALHGDAAARAGIAFDHQQAAMSGSSRCLRGATFDPHVAGHHVLGATHTDVAVHGD